MEGLPSKRYLNLIIEGAREANLDAAYIEKLVNHPIYTTPQDILDKRNLFPAPETLPKISYTDLKAMEYVDDKGHLSIFGYVLRVPKDKIMFKVHAGRDITAR